MSFLSEAKNQKFAILLAAGLFVVITCVISYPLIINFNHSIFAEIDDNLGVLWALWWVPYATFNLGTSPMHCPFIEAPFGIDVAFPAPLNYIISLPLSPLFSNVVVFNIIEFLGFVLAGLGMYLLVYYLTKSFIASLVSGIIYAFSPYHIGYTKHCLDFSQIQWFPFYLYFLFKITLPYKTKPRKRGIFFCGLFFTLAALTNGYYTVILVLITAIYIFVHLFPSLVLWYQRTVPPFKEIMPNIPPARLKSLKVFLGCLGMILFSTLVLKPNFWEKHNYFHAGLIVLFVIFIPKFIFMIMHFKDNWYSAIKRNRGKLIFMILTLAVMYVGGRFLFNTLVGDFWHTTIYPMQDYNIFTLRLIPGHFFIPPFDHPVLGGITRRFFPDFTPWDMCQYIGYATLSLALLGLIFWRRNGINQQRIIIFFILCLQLVLALGAKPIIRLFGSDVFMPAYYFHRFFPFFRDMKRLALLVMLAIAVLAGSGVSSLLKTKLSRIKKSLFLSVFILFISLEYFPRPLNMDLSNLPQAHRWLKSQEGDFIIAEYPFYNVLDVWRNDFMFFQTTHHKRVINHPRQGGAQSERADKFTRRATKDIFLMPDNAASALSFLGVKYVLFRTDRLGFRPIFKPDSGLRLIKSFGDIDIYQVVAPRADFIIDMRDNGDGDFYPTEYRADGKPIKWMSQTGIIGLVNLKDEPLKINFRFYARALKNRRKVKIEFNGSFLKEFWIGTDGNYYTLKNLSLLPRDLENKIILSVDGNHQLLDNKKVTIGFSSMEFKLTEK